MAQRFAVNTPFTWNSTAGTKWATTSGGAGGASVPTSTDDVIFDNNSGSGAITITTAACQSLDCGTGGTVFAGSITGSGNLGTITGIFRLNSTMGCTWTGTLTYTGTSGTTVLTSAGQTIGNLVVAGAGGTLQLADTFTNGAGKSILLSSGTFDTNGKTWNTPAFATSGTLTKVLNFTSGTAFISGTGTAFSLNAATGTTVNKGGTIKLTGSGVGITINGGSIPVGPVWFSAQTATFAMTTTALICGSLNFTGSAGTWGAVAITVQGDITLGASMVITAGANVLTWGVTSGTATLTSNGAVLDRPLTIDGVGGTHKLGDALNINARTLTLTNGRFDDNGKNITLAKLSSSNSNTRGVDFNGGTWSLSGSGTVIDFTTSAGFTSTVNTTTVSTLKFTDSSATGVTIASTSSIHLPNLWYSAGTGALVWPNQQTIQGLNFTGFSGTTDSANDLSINGDLTLSATATFAIAIWHLEGNSGATNTLTSNGATLGLGTATLHIGQVGVTWQLADDCVNGNTVDFDASGTFNTNNHNISATKFSSVAATSPTINMGSGTWTVTGALGWDFSAGTPTLNANTSTIKFTDGTATDKTFKTGGLTYYNVWDATTSTGKLNISGGGTMNDLRRDAAAALAHTITFKHGETFTTTTWNVFGSAGKLVTITSDTAATHTLVKAGGGVISCDYLAIDHSSATPGSTWYAGTNSTDNGNNSGWIFTAPPTGSIRRNPNLDGLSSSGSFFANPLGARHYEYQPHANDNEQRQVA